MTSAENREHKKGVSLFKTSENKLFIEEQLIVWLYFSFRRQN